MKKIISGVLFICLLVCMSNISRAQQPLTAFDTISLKQSQLYYDDYTLNDSTVTRISIQATAPVQMNDVKFKVGGDIWRGALTLISGIGIGGAKEVDWYLAASIRTNNTHYDWISDIYCPGYIEKQRARTTNSDGSHGVETSYVNVFSWQRGALGYIIESGDTIGWHYVVRNPKTDTATIQWANMVYNYTSGKTNINPADFAMLGEFLGKKSILFYNSAENRMYIFRQTELLGICQFAKIPSPLVRKKKRVYVQPSLLVNPLITGPEKYDVLRLSMVGKRFINAMESYHQ